MPDLPDLAWLAAGLTLIQLGFALLAWPQRRPRPAREASAAGSSTTDRSVTAAEPGRHRATGLDRCGPAAPDSPVDREVPRAPAEVVPTWNGLLINPRFAEHIALASMAGAGR